MVDRETLIKRNAVHGLETAIEISKQTVRLRKEHAEVLLNMLKEQDERLHKLQKDKDKLCLEVSKWKHKYHDRPLKEQEIVPVKEDKINKCECGETVCRHWHSKFCGFCGRELLWY